MNSITIPAKVNDHPHMRSMNMFRDLSAVADLIELCFTDTMDNDGQRYIADMRRASRDEWLCQLGITHGGKRITAAQRVCLGGERKSRRQRRPDPLSR